MPHARPVRKPSVRTAAAVGILVVSAAAFLVWPASVGSAANSASQAASAKASGRVLWTPKITRGRSAFADVQCATGGFRVVRDPVKGKVWRAHQPGGQERCEAVGPTLKSGSTFYLGWSSKVDIRDSKNRYIFQLKCSPSTGTANHPVELDAAKGRIRLQAWTHRHVAVRLWSAPVRKGSWHSYVLKIREGRTKGTVEFWFDGVKQRFANGTTRYTGTTYDGTTNYLKWGSYHRSPGDATHWFTSPRMATTRAAAAGS